MRKGLIALSLTALLICTAQSPVSFSTVESNLALQSLSPGQYSQVTRLGYNKRGDGGRAVYNWQSTNCSAADNITQVSPLRGNGCWVIDPASSIIAQGGAQGNPVSGTTRNLTTLPISVCAFASCSGQTTTGSISSGSPVLSLTAPIDFGTNPNCAGGGGNGCTIIIAGAGQPIGAGGYNIGPPGAVTASSFCSTFTITGNTVSGSSIIQNVSTLFGPSAGNGITGTGITGGTIITSINANPNTFRISNPATATGSATFTISDPCTTTRFYRVASYGPTLSLGQPAPAVSTSGAATPSWWNPDGVTWNRPSGTAPSGYVVWMSTDGGATYHFWQVTNIEGATGAPAKNVLIGGPQPLGNVGQTARPIPWWIPDDPSTIPLAGLSGYLATNIISGGGTNTVVLGTTALTTVASARVQHDDSAAWSVWGVAINGKKGVIPGSFAGKPVVINTSSQVLLSLSNSTIEADPAAFINMFGDINQGFAASYAVLVNGGVYPTLSSYVPPLYQNFQEGSHCIPLTSTAGLSPGQFLAVEQLAPAGPTQALNYFYGSVIRAITCDNNQVGVDMIDTTPVTFWSAGTNPASTEIQGSGTVTISGTLTPGDVILVSASGFGPFSGTTSYTVLSSDTLTTAARGLALAINAKWGASGEFAFHSLGMTTLVTPTVNQDTIWTITTAGTETLTIGTGVGFGVYTWAPITNVTVSGLTINATNAAPWELNGTVTPIGAFNTNVSNFKNMHIIDVQLGGAFLSDISYRQVVNDLQISNGAMGSPNGASYSDAIWSLGMKGQISNITSWGSGSFGPQIASASSMQVHNWAQSTSAAGRGVKFAAVAGSQFINITSESSSNKNISICCGSYNNSFDSISGSGAHVLNAMGVGGCFDDWTTKNRFNNVRAVGNNQYDICSEPADNHNQWNNVTVGSNPDPSSEIFPGILNFGDIFTNINGCDIAFGDTIGHVVCGPPMLRVFLGSNQAVPSGVLETVAFDNVDRDTGSYWNSGSNWWSPKVPGIYHACISIIGGAAPWAGTTAQAYIIKNVALGGGSQYLQLAQTQPAAFSGDIVLSGCANIPMNGVTDTLSANVSFSGTSTVIIGSGSARPTTMNIQRIGPST